MATLLRPARWWETSQVANPQQISLNVVPIIFYGRLGNCFPGSNGTLHFCRQYTILNQGRFIIIPGCYGDKKEKS